MPSYNENGTIDIIWDNPVHGKIPYTASPNNPDPDGAAVWDEIMAGNYGSVTAYVPPTAAEVLDAKRAAATMTPMEFALAIDAAGYTSQVDTLMADSNTPNSIKIMWQRASVFERMNTDLISMATQLGFTDTQIDAIFGIS